MFYFPDTSAFPFPIVNGGIVDSHQGVEPKVLFMKLSLDVNCCSKLIFDQISGISFKKWCVMFKPLIVSILLMLPVKGRP